MPTPTSPGGRPSCSAESTEFVVTGLARARGYPFSCPPLMKYNVTSSVAMVVAGSTIVVVVTGTIVVAGCRRGRGRDGVVELTQILALDRGDLAAVGDAARNEHRNQGNADDEESSQHQTTSSEAHLEPCAAAGPILHPRLAAVRLGVLGNQAPTRGRCRCGAAPPSRGRSARRFAPARCGPRRVRHPPRASSMPWRPLQLDAVTCVGPPACSRAFSSRLARIRSKRSLSTQHRFVGTFGSTSIGTSPKP